MAINRQLSVRLLALGMASSLPMTGWVAEASTAQLAVNVGVGVTDNLERVELSGRSEEITSLGLELSVQETTRRLQADISGEFAFLKYSGGVYEDDLIGSGSGSVRVSLLPGRLEWTLEDRFGQARQDMFVIPTPDSIENVNYLITGPELTLPLAASWQLRAAARYGRTDYQSSPLDSTRYNGSFGIEHLLAGNGVASIDIEATHIDPKADFGTSRYDMQVAAISYRTQGARTGLRVKTGFRRIDQSGSSDSGLLVELGLTRKVGNIANILVEAGREYGDNGDVIRISGDQPPILGGSQALQQTADAFTLDHVRAAYGIAGRYTNIDLSANWTREAPAIRPAETRKGTSLGASVSRRFGSRLEGSLGLLHSWNEFDDPAFGDFSETDVTAGVSWRIGARLFTSITGNYYQYKYKGAAHSAEERRLWLRVEYGGSSVRTRGMSTVR